MTKNETEKGAVERDQQIKNNKYTKYLRWKKEIFRYKEIYKERDREKRRRKEETKGERWRKGRGETLHQSYLWSKKKRRACTHCFLTISSFASRLR